MIAGMARLIRRIEVTFGPVSKTSRFERNAVGLGAAPWKTTLVTLAMASGKSELTRPAAKPNDRPSIKRPLYGVTYLYSRRYGPHAAQKVCQNDGLFFTAFPLLMKFALPAPTAANPYHQSRLSSRFASSEPAPDGAKIKDLALANLPARSKLDSRAAANETGSLAQKEPLGA